MKNLDELKQKHAGISSAIRNLSKSIEEAKSGGKVKIGSDYHMVETSGNEIVIKALEEIKLHEEEAIKPLTERLKILDELAAEVLK